MLMILSSENRIQGPRAWWKPVLLSWVLSLGIDGASAGEGDFPFRWKDRVYRYAYNPSGEPDWLRQGNAIMLIQQAAKEWEACGIRFEYVGETDKQPGDMDGVNIVGWRQDGVRYSAWTKWRARRSTGAAIEADVILYANIYDDYRRRGMDAELELYKSIAHEFGHVLGLGHSDVASDVMSVRVRTQREWRLPSERDISRCRENYPTSTN